ncbi:MAG: 4-vinyl reductase [Chloroflexi bacterium]|nr:4-vinyl reductase [Chloroflexota bacterium]
METIPLSGLYYPNKMTRIFLLAMEEIMGKNGLNAVLNMSKLPELIDNYPPDDLGKEFDFAKFTALNAALEEMYGPRGGRGLALRGGRASFARGLQGFGALAGVGDLAFKVLPLGAKLKMGLPAMAGIFTQVSDQISRVEEKDDHFEYFIDRCPVCWGRKTDKAVCHVAMGVLQEGLRWVSGGKEFRVDEVNCIATGHVSCVFHVYKEPIG